jgi:hypothetical protein
MKRLYLLLICFFLPFIGLAQSCLPEGITFTNQPEINSFQWNYLGCIRIEGDVTIIGDGITNLDGLNVLTSVGGNLNIGTATEGNPALSSLTGLENIDSIEGNLLISHNILLTYSQYS